MHPHAKTHFFALLHQSPFNGGEMHPSAATRKFGGEFEPRRLRVFLPSSGKTGTNFHVRFTEWTKRSTEKALRSPEEGGSSGLPREYASIAAKIHLDPTPE